MDSNPYTPPKAPIEKVESDSSERPKHVIAAVGLNVAALVMGLMKAEVNPVQGPSIIAYGSVGIVFALLAAVWFRQNWARWVALALFVLAIPSFFLIPQFYAVEGFETAAVMVLHATLQGIGTALLFTSSSNSWYRRLPVR